MRKRLLGVLSVLGASIALSLGGVATAHAACSVVNKFPYVEKISDRNGGEYYIWGRVDIKGCESTSISVYLCWRQHNGCSARQDYVRPENGLAYSLRNYHVCSWGAVSASSGRRVGSGSTYRGNLYKALC